MESLLLPMCSNGPPLLLTTMTPRSMLTHFFHTNGEASLKTKIARKGDEPLPDFSH